MDKHLHKAFHALGDPTRLAIVEQLLKGPASVSDLAQPHAMALPAFTKHLGILQRAGLIDSKKSGRVRTCFVNPAGIERIDGWFADRRALWQRRLDRLATHLDASNEE